MNRILVLGGNGAGKSTLAARIGRIFDLPVIHLDRHFWNPGWIETEQGAWRKAVTELTARQQWVMDGNYHNSLDVRIPVADLIVFLDFPTSVCLFRVIKRRFQYHKNARPDMAKGCDEKIDVEFLLWILNFRRRIKPRIMKLIDAFDARSNLIVLKNDREIEGFVKNLDEKK